MVQKDVGLMSENLINLIAAFHTRRVRGWTQTHYARNVAPTQTLRRTHFLRVFNRTRAKAEYQDWMTRPIHTAQTVAFIMGLLAGAIALLRWQCLALCTLLSKNSVCLHVWVYGPFTIEVASVDAKGGYVFHLRSIRLENPLFIDSVFLSIKVRLIVCITKHPQRAAYQTRGRPILIDIVSHGSTAKFKVSR